MLLLLLLLVELLEIIEKSLEIEEGYALVGLETLVPHCTQ